jgi:hypothetical protein
VHDLIQGQWQYATAEIGIFVELKVHFSANVVIRYLGEALLPKVEALRLLQLFFDWNDEVEAWMEDLHIGFESGHRGGQSNKLEVVIGNEWL